MPGLDILISGAGIAGPAVAYWLLEGNAEHRITIVERAPDLRIAGQSIDIRQAAVKIIQRMGIEDAVRAKTTTEKGLQFVDETGKPFATFGASGQTETQSFTSEFEILRGDLVEILFDKVRDRIRVVYGEYIKDCRKDAKGGRARVEFVNGREPERYDVVIAADGQSSRLRQLVLDNADTPRENWRTFNQYFAYFTLKAEDLPSNLSGDGNMALWYNSTGGRLLFLRPDPVPGQCRANIGRQLLPSDELNNKRYRDALSQGKDAVKALLKKDFVGAGWVTDQVVAGMDAADDFYANETAQIRCPFLYKDNIVLLGDAGYCPTPLTGMGTSLAIIGSYILAGEINKANAGTAEEIEQAFKSYNDIILPYARKVQSIPTWLPQIVNPQTSWGLSAVRTVLWLVSASGIVSLFTKLSGIVAFGGDDFKLPEY